MSKKMVYVMSVTSTGQVTIPKVVREKMGIKDIAEVEFDGKKVIITRAKSLRERMAELHESFTPEEREAIRKNAGKTANQLREELEMTPEGRAYARRVYGA